MDSLIYTIEMLIELIKESEKDYDIEKVYSAYEMAYNAHIDQKRVSGDPYISHPVAVSYIMVNLGMDTDSVCAALLHDVAEDTDITISVIEKKFGKDISLMVDGVTKLGKVPLSTKKETQAENIRKMFLAMSKDIRVVIIKLSDRLHNMRTLHFMYPQKQRDKSLETMEIYAPIAHRLGIRSIKEELEDLALKYLDRVACEEIDDLINLKKEDREKFIEKIKTQVLERILKYNISPTIEGRVKSRYGIYRKVYMAGKSFEEVYDIFGVRIIVDTVIECYNVLGIVHDMFRPIPNRFKDYVSTPKPNMYQSLHTTLIGREGIPFEIQIRTWDMHYTAEYGIAAHWKYKAGIEGKDKLEDKLTWIRQMIESQKEAENADDIVYSIKNDIGAEEVFVYTPNGEVKSLPIGSTIIDFAYSIHSAVGNRTIGAKVDGRMVSLDYEVKTGEIIEILTTNNENHAPSRNWLQIVKTSQAKNKIRNWYKKQCREENISEGKLEISKELKRNLIRLSDEEIVELLEPIVNKHHFSSFDDFYAAIGYGGLQLSKIITRIKEDYNKIVKQKKQSKSSETLPTYSIRSSKKNSSSIMVEGLDNCLIKFSKCCNPLPSDKIVGFITRGYGVSVHKKDCENVKLGLTDDYQKDRWINISWVDSDNKFFRSTIDILASDRTSLLVDVSNVISNIKVPVHRLFARELKRGDINIVIDIEVAGIEQLNNLIQKIKKIDGIISVERSKK